jgi:eukaryotic-like serine/threonine-protein kinase
MSLAPGARLGPYEILSALGAGGMGEVYRARDTRLGRTVAVKVLPSALAADAEARARLHHEAKAISTLTHPNICTLFDVGHEDGTDYLVMEYLDGVTLADRLKGGPLPIDDVRHVAAQIAAALAKAHERGIVHRDLKPGNVMLTKAGADRPGSPQVRLLDFGLAKLKAPDTGGLIRSAVTTEQALTVQGTIVGTLPYMAPEQIDGRAVDARSDLFAFGAVLYEMVTGRRAFPGDSAASVLAAVIGSQPAPPRSLRPDIPVGLERLIVTCLAKDPADRWQSALDIVLYLENSEGTVPEARQTVSWIRPWVVAAVLAVGAALGLGAGWGLKSVLRDAPSAQLMRLAIPLSADGQLVPPSSPRAGSSVALSRDGRRLVYRSKRNGRNVLVLRTIDRTEETVLSGSEGGFGPFFSPDGNWVAFFTESALKKLPLDGGSPVTVCPTPPVSRGGSWADDDTIYFTPDFTSGVHRVNAAGGRPQAVTAPDLVAKESNHLFPEALPGGDVLLFTVWKGGTFGASSTWAFSTRTGKRTLVIEGASEARYLPQGYLVFAQAGTLLAAPFDVKTLALVGAATPVVDGVWNDPATGTAHYAVSHTGTLVYASGQYTVARSRIAWVDRRGGVEFLPCEPGLYSEPKLSPDGRRLAVQLLNDIWVYDFGTGTLTRTTSRGVNQAPVWTPDGRHIAFSSSQNVTRPTLYWVDPAGGEEPEMLSRGGEVQFPSSWSPDGTTLAYAEIKVLNPETDYDIWLLSGPGSWTRRNLIRTPFKDDQPMFSPDGRALAWVSNETGTRQVYVRPYAGTGRTMVSTDGGAEPIWSRNGSELFYRSGRRVFSVPINTKGTLAIGRPSVLFEGDFDAGSATPGIPNYDVAADGRFIMVASAADAALPTRLDVAINWVEELRRKVARQPGR